MKSYMSYDADGRLVGIHTHKHAGTNTMGWAADCRLDNPNCPNPTSKWFRENVVGKNGVVGFIAYNCACPPARLDCTCVNTAFATKRVVDGALVDKHEVVILADNEVVMADSLIRRPPGTRLQIELSGAVADGETVLVQERSVVAVMDEPSATLTFTGGKTSAVTLVAPAQGMTGLVSIWGRDIIPMKLSLRGWA